MISRTLPVTLAFAGLASLCPDLHAQDSVRLARMTQTVDYERYLIAEEELTGRTDFKDVAWHAANSPSGKTSPAEPTPVRDTVNVRLSIVDASSTPLQIADYERLIAQLNTTFDFSDLDQGLERINFCLAGVQTATGPYTFPTVEDSEVQVLASASRSESSLRDSLDLEAAFGSVAELTGGRILTGGTIPLYVVDASDAVLGFASTAPHDGPTDVIVAARELLSGGVADRADGKTVAHLVANYLGLKPLWYDETGAGDLVGDTPCHNAPNFGTYAGSTHLSFCDGMPRELIENIMDNTDERIRSSWTAGQVSVLARWLGDDALRGGLVQAEPCEREGLVARSQEEDPLPEGVRAFTLHPNPADYELVVSLAVEAPRSPDASDQSAILTIVDFFGREVGEPVQVRKVGGERRLDVSDLPAGKYVVRLVTSGGWVATRSFVKLASAGTP